MPICFLDLAIGNDLQEFERNSAEHQRLDTFLKQKGASFGVPSSIDALIEQLQDEGVDVSTTESLNASEMGSMILQLYNSDPKYVSLGPARMVPKFLLKSPVIRLLVDVSEECPKACENFVSLCTGSKGQPRGHKRPLWYKQCHMWRHVPGFILQGGDVGRDDGSGQTSIYGGTFNDEKSGLNRPLKWGSVAMANSGRNTNTSQFFIVLAVEENDERLQKIQGKHVCFGQIIQGLDLLQQRLSRLETVQERPKEEILIVDCGMK